MKVRIKNRANRVICFLAACGLVAGAAVAKAASQPIFNEHADSRRDIAAAISKASTAGRNIVLIFGANW